MKKIFISLLTLIGSATLGMAQVTLKKYDDPKKSQFVEKIIFGEANSPMSYDQVYNKFSIHN